MAPSSRKLLSSQSSSIAAEQAAAPDDQDVWLSISTTMAPASSSAAGNSSSSSDAVALHRGLHELEDELRCPICNDFLKVPVSVVNCHHTFCNSCVKAKLRQNLSSLARAATCPQCNEGPLDTRGGEFARCLVPNHTVEAVVQHFQAIRQPLLTTLRQQQQQQAGTVIVSNGATAASNDDAAANKSEEEEEEKSSANSKPRRSMRRTTRASSKDGSPSEKEEEEDEESLEEAQDIKQPAIENKNDNNKNDAQQAPPRKKKPRTLYQNFKSKKSLVELCRQEGLSTEGEKEELKTRHAAYIDKYNAECDSRHPRPVAALRRELERDERDKRAARQQPQIQHGASCFEKICAQRELLGKDPHTVWTTVPLSGDEAFDQEMLASFDNLIKIHRKRFPEQGSRRRPWAVVEAAMQEAEAAMPAHHSGKAATETKPNTRKPWSWTQNAKSKQPKTAAAVAVPAAAASSATNGSNAALPSAAAPTAVHNPYAAASKKRSSTGSTSTTQGGRTTGGGTGLKPAPAVATNPYRSQQNGRLSFSTSAALAPLAASASLEPAPAVATNPYRSQPQQPQGRPFFSDSVPASIAATARAKQGLLGPEEVQVFDRIWGSLAQQQQSLSATASSGSASSLSQQYQSSSTATSGDSASAAASSAPLSATSNAGVLHRNLTPEEDQVRARIFGPSPASQQSSTATTSTVRTLSGSSNENASPAESSSSTNSANGSTNKRKSPRQSKLNLQVVPKKPRPERKKSSPSSTTADNTSSSSLVGPWSCPTCTFHNEKSRSSMAQCEMCRSCRRCGQSKCTCRHSSSSSNGGSSQQSSQQSSASATSAASRETICID